MSTYRSISFCGDLLPRAAIALSYTVQFGHDRKAGKSLVVERKSPALWRELHEGAVAKEWDAVMEEVLPSSSQRDQKEGLRGLGPAGFLTLAEQSGNDEEFAPLIARLRHRALPILERRTVFLLPEKLSASPLELDDLIETWADQLYEQLSRGHSSAFTFVRVGDPGTDPGMLDRMIEHMHSKIAALAFEHGKDDREGPILLVGPTGTGKSYGMRLFAKKTWGKDKFVNVNLAAVTETTLESRVRGYVRGAFTGADAAGKASWFEEAHGGTLFLDEFQSVRKEYQTQFLDLLNSVSDKVEIARVGNDKKREVFQVKVVLAINEDLGELLRTDRLRHDLFYRIRRIIRFKTLKERLSDPDTNRAGLMVLLMTYRWRLAPRIQQSSRGRVVDGAPVDDLPASRLHAMFAQFEDAAVDAMLRHDWPGNLRELERVASDLFCDADQRLDSTIRYEHVIQVIAEFFIPHPTQAAGQLASVSMIAESTRVILASVERALRQQRFNIGSILDGLKVYKLGSRPTLRRFLVKHKDLLSADIAAESKVQRFMQTRE
jgi:DNA-binding NtrC family response regulator